MLHSIKTCDIRVSHATFEAVMLRMDESCHMWMSQVTYACWLLLPSIKHDGSCTGSRCSKLLYQWLDTRPYSTCHHASSHCGVSPLPSVFRLQSLGCHRWVNSRNRQGSFCVKNPVKLEGNCKRDPRIHQLYASNFTLHRRHAVNVVAFCQPIKVVG